MLVIASSMLVACSSNITSDTSDSSKNNPKVEIYATNDALGALRIQAEAYPAAAEINQAAYESTQKDYTGETCAAIELKNVHGTISNKLGETIDVNF